ncbi:MAG: GNAT family N-acetyltransferase [Patescibacteria group bacterium]|nr:GNAT family N-acetyltransferase [Patescibacteria group bacterium]MDE2116729.1 GNAT family N-acetyltransferase [Patescibacteria group bacterium]
MNTTCHLIRDNAEFYTLFTSELVAGGPRFSSFNKLLAADSPGTPAMTVAQLEAFFRAGGILAVVMTDRGKLIAMATVVRLVKINSTTYRIEHVAVSPDYRRKGFGRQVMSLISSTIRKEQHRYADLSVGEGNVAARRLYESLGFKERESVQYRYTFPK